MEKDQENLAKYFQEMRAILHGDGTHDLDPKLIQELVDASMKENIPSMISQGLPMLEFKREKMPRRRTTDWWRKNLETGTYKVADELSGKERRRGIGCVDFGYEKQKFRVSVRSYVARGCPTRERLEKVLRRESFLKFSNS